MPVLTYCDLQKPVGVVNASPRHQITLRDSTPTAESCVLP